MAGKQKLLASQIAGDLGHERAWNLGKKKEDDEGDSVLPLTCAGDGPWRLESVREELAAGAVHGGRPTAAVAATETKL